MQKRVGVKSREFLFGIILLIAHLVVIILGVNVTEESDLEFIDEARIGNDLGERREVHNDLAPESISEEDILRFVFLNQLEYFLSKETPLLHVLVHREQTHNGQFPFFLCVQ